MCLLCDSGSPSSDVCEHEVCRGCARSYLREQLLEKKWGLALIRSPCGECGGFLTPEQLARGCQGDAQLSTYLDALLATLPSKAHATQLPDFGYEIQGGRVVNSRLPGNSFHYVSELHYAALGDVVARHIQQMMLAAPYDLREVDLNGNNVFVSREFDTCDTLLLLIQGTGAVRAGQWARALCLNESLEVGSILPYLERARAAGWGVVVFNPNFARRFEPDVAALEAIQDVRSYWLQPSKQARAPGAWSAPFPGHSSMPEHTLTVYDALVARAQASRIGIVAHSAGGSCTMTLLRERPALLEKLRVVAFTDSDHSISRRDPQVVRDFLRSNAVNYAQSQQPLDTPLRNASDTSCAVVSAGHPKHEWTSASAINSVFRLLAGRLDE